MKEFNIDLLSGKKANFSYEIGNEKVYGEHTHFKLGDLELSLVARDFSRSWDYASVGTIFESRDYYREEAMDNINYSDPILVEVKTKYYDLPKDTGNCLLAFVDPSTEELVAYISIIHPNELEQSYCTFEVLQTASAVQNNLQDRLLR